MAVWIIQKKSPQSMQGYKKYLIAITLATFNFDMGMSVLVGPKFLPGAVGTENHGIIARLWPSGGRYQIYFISMSIVLEYEFCVIGFSYREYSMLKEKSWKTTAYRLFQFFVYLLALVLATVTYFYQNLPEEEARAYMEKIQSNYCRECSIQVIPDREKTIYMTYLTIATIILLTSFVVISIYRIKHYLVTHRGSLSSNTVKLQEMLLRALIWQSVIPFLLVAFPLTLAMLSFYAVPLFTNNYEPQAIQENLSAIAYLMPSFFSITHIFCNFYFTSPYRLYILKQIRPKQKTTVIL